MAKPSACRLEPHHVWSDLGSLSWFRSGTADDIVYPRPALYEKPPDGLGLGSQRNTSSRSRVDTNAMAVNDGNEADDAGDSTAPVML
jgi:hypothetical protein